MAPKAAPPTRAELSSPPVGAPIQLNQASSSRGAPAKAGTFEGRVVSSATGQGVPSAEITFEHESGAMSVRTGADGSFAFQPAHLGHHRLAAILARDYLPFAPEWGHSPVQLTARAGERIRDIVLFLTPALEYLGVVLDPKGEFRFRAPAWAWLEAKHPSFSAARARVDAMAQTSRRLELRLSDKDAGEVEPNETLAGQVVDPKGLPISGASVYAQRRARRGWGGGFSAKSDADGRFAFEGLLEGRYDIVATYPGFAAGRADSVPSGTTTVQLQLAAGARLRGKVRDRNSAAPVVAFNVSIQRARGALQRDSLSDDAFMDAQGQYEISGLPAGSYAAIAAGYGYAPSREIQFSISEALEEKTIDFELERGGELVGSVVDAK